MFRCLLTFMPTLRDTPGGLRLGPNSSSPADPSFARLLPLYTSPRAAYAVLAHIDYTGRGH